MTRRKRGDFCIYTPKAKIGFRTSSLTLFSVDKTVKWLSPSKKIKLKKNSKPKGAVNGW